MYKYKHPKPIVVKLTDELGFRLRQKAAEYIAANQNLTGAERGSSEEQGFGALAEMIIRNKLGMPEINPKDHPLGYDLLLNSGVKVDVKCRGGALPFKEEYESDDGIAREAKHNFFARQIYDENLDTDIYVMTHLETPSNRELPGTTRQRKWILYICGWVSKERVANEGVYLPRGSLTEQGRTWFTYDLIGRGVLSEKHLAFVQKETKLEKIVKPVLHSNQYFHLLKWLKGRGILTDKEMGKARKVLQEELFSGI